MPKKKFCNECAPFTLVLQLMLQMVGSFCKGCPKLQIWEVSARHRQAKVNSTSQCNVKDVFLSRAARYEEVEHTSGNNKILACIFNFLQTSREVIQVRRSESKLSGSTCITTVMFPFLSSRVHWMVRLKKWMLYWPLEHSCTAVKGHNLLVLIELIILI